MNEQQIKQRAEEILYFVTQIACPFGSTNLGPANEARIKILENRRLQNKTLDWLDLEVEDRVPWQTSELEGVRSVIAGDLQYARESDIDITVYSFQDVIKVAQQCIRYGTGRCSGMASVGIVFNQELDPSIPVTVMHYTDPENSSQNHTLLFVGFDAANRSRTCDSVYFCDPWVNKVGSLFSIHEHLNSIGIKLQGGNKLMSVRQWCPDGSVTPDKPITPAVLEQRQSTIDEINELHQKFIHRNNELLGFENQSIRILRRHFPNLAITGFLQDPEDCILGARITPNMLSDQTSVVSQLAAHGLYCTKASNMTADVIIDGINGRNAESISKSIKRG